MIPWITGCLLSQTADLAIGSVLDSYGSFRSAFNGLPRDDVEVSLEKLQERNFVRRYSLLLY